MKTSNLAFVALPVLLSSFAAGARAQSAVNLYGVLDAGVVAERGCSGDCPSAKVSPGVAAGSRLGIQGREALGGDLAAVFTLEAGILNDTGASDQGGRLFGRQAFVGLNSRWGALTLGRQYNLQYEALADVADPFHDGMAGTAANLVGYTLRRYDNTVKYVSPTLNGASASAIYSFGESPFSSKYNRAYGLTLGYGKGPFNVRVAHQRKRNMIEGGGMVPLADFSARNTLAAANVNFKYVTAYAAYGYNRGVGSSPWDAENPYGALVLASPSTDSRDVLVGLSKQTGAATWMVSYIRKDDRTLADQDATQAAAGVSYSMSRRTSLYAAYARINNRNGAPYTVGNATEAGRGNSAVNIGLRHNF